MIQHPAERDGGAGDHPRSPALAALLERFRREGEPFCACGHSLNDHQRGLWRCKPCGCRGFSR
jgi:hypothetical protein